MGYMETYEGTSEQRQALLALLMGHHGSTGTFREGTIKDGLFGQVQVLLLQRLVLHYPEFGELRLDVGLGHSQHKQNPW